MVNCSLCFQYSQPTVKNFFAQSSIIKINTFIFQLKFISYLLTNLTKKFSNTLATHELLKREFKLYVKKTLNFGAFEPGGLIAPRDIVVHTADQNILS